MKRILLSIFLFAIPFGVVSQNFSNWTGAGDWSNNTNWTSGTGYGQLQFLGGGSASPCNNDINPLSQWRLYFTGNKAYTLTGAQVNLYDFGGAPSWVLNEGSAMITISLPLSFSDTNGHRGWITTKNSGGITFTNNLNVNNSLTALRIGGFNTSAPVNINGLLSCAVPVEIGKDEAGNDQSNTRVFLNGNNSGFSGSTTIYAGTLTIPENSALGTGLLTIGNGTVAGTLAATGNTTRSQGIRVTDNSTAASIDVASGKTFELTGVLSQSGSNQATKIGKSGAGTLTLSGTATYQGQIQIGQGTVIVNNNSGLGVNTSTANRGVDLGLNVGDVSQPNNVSLFANNGFTVSQSIYVAPNTSGATRAIGLNGSGAAVFSNAIYLGGNLTVSAGASGAVTLSGAAENTGGLIANGGTVVLSGNNTYTGSTVVNAGTLRLGASNRISSDSPIVLAGGTFSSGASIGFSDSLGTLSLAANSTIRLGTGNHTLTFANSSAIAWAGTVLTITGWTGTAGQSNTAGGKIMVGTAGLTASQVNKITFTGYTGTPIILPSGELVPPGPSLALTSGTPNQGAACINLAAPTTTFTITNNGATATGISVVSDNPEFSVSNLSSTTIATGGTATYAVTFMPDSSGLKSGTVTISTVTPNANTISSALSGTGNPLPTATVEGTATVCMDSAPPGITFTGFSGTAPYTFTYRINGGSEQTVTTLEGQNATVPVPTDTPGGFQYSLTNIQDAFGCSNTQGGSATVTVNASPSVFYADVDGDSYGDLATPVTSCDGQPPLYAGHLAVSDATDCDDTNSELHARYYFYVDSDGDTYGSTTSEAVCTINNSTPPAGYSLSYTDCNDADAALYQYQTFYIDADNDGYGAQYYDGGFYNARGSVCSGVGAPSGYAVTIFGADCDDLNTLKYRSAFLYLDSDGDGYDAGLNQLCYGTVVPPGYATTTLGADCDDSNPEIFQYGYYYIDNDGDNYSGGGIYNSDHRREVCSGYGPPQGYSNTSAGSDCDDFNPNVHEASFITYIDNDGDGYGIGYLYCNNFGPFSSDCDDNNAAVHDSILLYYDADGDGFYSSSAYLCDGDIPAGYILNPVGPDCDDNNAAVHRGGYFYVDADGDGYDNSSVNLCYGSGVPSGHSLTTLGPDCNDADAAVYQRTLFYTDADADGYNVGQDYVCYGATIPAGHTLTTLGYDCDDTEATKYQQTFYYIDADGDGYDGGAALVCSGAAVPSGYSPTTLGSDCDDANAASFQNAYFYQDADADGYTALHVYLCVGTTTPDGYTLTSLGSDCDDTNALIYTSNFYYFDADGDGYHGGGGYVCLGAEIPEGYALTTFGFDCDDTDASRYLSTFYYIDADVDGYTLGGTYICLGDEIPANHTLETLGSDCDDADPLTFRTGTAYTDLDDDGYDAGSAVICYGAELPDGLSLTSSGTDCNDTDAGIYTGADLFVDADGDGYDAGISTICYGATLPAGHSTTTSGTDCNDSDATLTTNCSPVSVIVNLKMFIEGYYTGNGSMTSVALNQDYVSEAADVEMITVELHDATTYELVASASAMLHTDGMLSASFSTAPSGSFYIAVKGSNINQTWSAEPQAIGSTPLSYDFTSSASQAYGDNMREVETGVFAVYSGDINQDEVIDNSDLDTLFPDIENSNFGVLATDLNGDGVVDNSDLDNVFISIENSRYSNHP